MLTAELREWRDVLKVRRPREMLLFVSLSSKYEENYGYDKIEKDHSYRCS